MLIAAAFEAVVAATESGEKLDLERMSIPFIDVFSRKSSTKDGSFAVQLNR
jgi:hypothetical protein